MSNKEQIKAALARVNAMRGDAGTMDYDKYDGVLISLYSALDSGHRDVLRQLMEKPTWDGDICSKVARDDLIDWGLAVRCCFKFEQGYTTATYLAGSLWRNVVEGV